MVFAVKPVSELVNVAVPVPSSVLVDSATVGLVDVLQTTPFAVTAYPASLDIAPPDEAVV